MFLHCVSAYGICASCCGFASISECVISFLATSAFQFFCDHRGSNGANSTKSGKSLGPEIPFLLQLNVITRESVGSNCA